MIVCPISSRPLCRETRIGDRPLANWNAAGLRFPSAARVSNILAIDKSLIRRVLGKLAPEDLRSLDAGLCEALGLP